MAFCRRCYAAFMKRWRDNPKNKGLELIDPKSFVFKCQIPIYDPSGHGEVRFRVYNCKLERYETISQAEWEKRRNEFK